MKGKRFGRWLVLCEAGRSDSNDIEWLCECDCGVRKIINGSMLRIGRTHSCGCLRKDMATKHGVRGANKKLYNVWWSMNVRCSDNRNKHYKYYGGRGILVCDEWKKNPVAFYNWAMENGYKEGLQIDRIDNNGNYEPENCRFVTAKENARNTSRNRILKYNGISKCVTEWAEDFDIAIGTLFSRLNNGWSIERALTQPVRGEK